MATDVDDDILNALNKKHVFRVQQQIGVHDLLAASRTFVHDDDLLLVRRVCVCVRLMLCRPSAPTHSLSSCSSHKAI